MRRGIVLDKYNNHVAVMTPNSDFLKIKKDPLVCTVGEEIWFSEKDIILPGLKKFFNKKYHQATRISHICYFIHHYTFRFLRSDHFYKNRRSQKTQR